MPRLAALVARFVCFVEVASAAAGILVLHDLKLLSLGSGTVLAAFHSRLELESESSESYCQRRWYSSSMVREILRTLMSSNSYSPPKKSLQYLVLGVVVPRHRRIAGRPKSKRFPPLAEVPCSRGGVVGVSSYLLALRSNRTRLVLDRLRCVRRGCRTCRCCCCSGDESVRSMIIHRCSRRTRVPGYRPR